MIECRFERATHKARIAEMALSKKLGAILFWYFAQQVAGRRFSATDDLLLGSQFFVSL
jgi:hypothetical protein